MSPRKQERTKIIQIMTSGGAGVTAAVSSLSAALGMGSTTDLGSVYTRSNSALPSGTCPVRGKAQVATSLREALLLDVVQKVPEACPERFQISE